jgi:hypothetical protein
MLIRLKTFKQIKNRLSISLLLSGPYSIYGIYVHNASVVVGFALICIDGRSAAEMPKIPKNQKLGQQILPNETLRANGHCH